MPKAKVPRQGDSAPAPESEGARVPASESLYLFDKLKAQLAKRAEQRLELHRRIEMDELETQRLELHRTIEKLVDEVVSRFAHGDAGTDAPSFREARETLQAARDANARFGTELQIHWQELDRIRRQMAETAERVEALKLNRGKVAFAALRGWLAASVQPGKSLLSKNDLRTRPGETGPRKAARLREMERRARDEALARAMATLIGAGESTESARLKLGIGVVRSQRVRALAVRMGLLPHRQ